MGDFQKIIDGKKPNHIRSEFTELSEVEGFDNFCKFHEDAERITRYMLLMYHPSSPLIEKYTSVKRRKGKAGEYAGYKITKDEDQKKLEGLVDLSNDGFYKILQSFLKHINNRVWSMIVANETAFDEFRSQVMMPLRIGDKDKDVLKAAEIKSTILKKMKEIDEDLQAYYHKFFMDDKELIDKETKKGGISPEMIAGNVQKT